VNLLTGTYTILLMTSSKGHFVTTSIAVKAFFIHFHQVVSTHFW